MGRGDYACLHTLEEVEEDPSKSLYSLLTQVPKSAYIMLFMLRPDKCEMCLFDGQGLPRWPDPGKIATRKATTLAGSSVENRALWG